MHIVYAFIIIDLISCVRCMETDKHYCKCIIHRSIMYCLIYYGTKLFIVYMNIVYAFILIDLMCVRCMETEKHYCIINEYAFITSYICLWHFSIMFSNVPPPPYYLLCTEK